MLGAIIGDTVGSIYEFHNTKNYDFELFNSSSAYTDDSIMSMAVAYWLLKDPLHQYETLEKSMLDFAETYPCPMGGYGGGFCRWLFHPNHLGDYDGKMGALPYLSPTGRHPYGSWGNGSAMRCSACGWFFDSLEETENVAEIKAYVEATYGYDLSCTWEEYNKTYQWESSCQGTVPPAMVCFLESRTRATFPKLFNDILSAMKERTAYGNLTPNKECL